MFQRLSSGLNSRERQTPREFSEGTVGYIIFVPRSSCTLQADEPIWLDVANLSTRSYAANALHPIEHTFTQLVQLEMIDIADLLLPEISTLCSFDITNQLNRTCRIIVIVQKQHGIIHPLPLSFLAHLPFEPSLRSICRHTSPWPGPLPLLPFPPQST